MANPRSSIKRKDEQYNVNVFIETLNRRHGASFRVIGEPDPPDAIIKSGRTTRWVEVVTVFLSDAYARDLYSYATPGEKHVSISNGPFFGMDEMFAQRFVAAVKSKLEKKNYVPFREKYGPGYLLIPIRNIFLTKDSMDLIKKKWGQTVVDDLGCFRSAYVKYPSGNIDVVKKWR